MRSISWSNIHVKVEANPTATLATKTCNNKTFENVLKIRENLRHVQTEFLCIREGETTVSGEHVYRRVGDFDGLSYH